MASLTLYVAGTHMLIKVLHCELGQTIALGQTSDVVVCNAVRQRSLSCVFQ